LGLFSSGGASDKLLPTIRQYGAYATDSALDELLGNPKFGEALLQSLVEERGNTEHYRALSDELQPKAEFCENVLQSDSLIAVSVIAKDYGMAAKDFNELLHSLRVQYKIGGTWLLYQKYADKGYTKSKTYCVGEKVAAIHTYWTQRGRMFLYGYLRDYGVLPMLSVDVEIADGVMYSAG
jgi:phage antirepressor YoqD-like protein